VCASIRQWGSLAGDASMTLAFDNITQAAYAQIKAAHTAARGPVEDVAFPAIVSQNLERGGPDGPWPRATVVLRLCTRGQPGARRQADQLPLHIQGRA
jgi:hypothetical protein